MGWSNYIIIPDWKLIIETNRSVKDIEDYIKLAIDKMIDSYAEDIDTSDLKISDITVKDLCTLVSAYDNVSTLSQIDVDKILLYWLQSREIKYEIKSEYEINIKQYEENGYNVIKIM